MSRFFSCSSYLLTLGMLFLWIYNRGTTFLVVFELAFLLALLGLLLLPLFWVGFIYGLFCSSRLAILAGRFEVLFMYPMLEVLWGVSIASLPPLLVVVRGLKPPKPPVELEKSSGMAFIAFLSLDIGLRLTAVKGRALSVDVLLFLRFGTSLPTT